MSDRPLRVAAAFALAGIAAFGAGSWWRARDPSQPWALPVVVGGSIDHYADDTLVVSTSTRGRLRVRVGPGTAVTDVDVPGTLGALLPGRFVVARGHPPADDEPFVAETILTWGVVQR